MVEEKLTLDGDCSAPAQGGPVIHCYSAAHPTVPDSFLQFSNVLLRKRSGSRRFKHPS